MCKDGSVFTLCELKSIKKSARFRTVTIGDRFGKLQVIDVYRENNKTYCRCKCDCGEECIILKSQIYSRRSCGRCSVYNFKDLTNYRFGRWLVIDYIPELHKWYCVCDCGNGGYVHTGDLTSGHSKSCGCLGREMASISGRKDLIGKRFGKLVVIDRETTGGYKVGKYICQCDCGNIIKVSSNNLIQGSTQSCGCLLPNINGSKAENEIKSFIENVSGKEFRKVKILNGKEIDMYNDDLKLGIEYNGSYFHASINNVYTDKSKNYHRDKFFRSKETEYSFSTDF